MTFIPHSLFLWNDLVDSVFDGVGLAGLRVYGQYFFVDLSCYLPFRLPVFSRSLPFFYFSRHCGVGAMPIFYIIIIIIIINKIYLYI